MLNGADTYFLFTILFSPFAGFAAGLAYKAGISGTILFTLGGLAAGILLARLFSKLAYFILDSKRLGDAPKFFLYLIIPLLGIILTLALPFVIGRLIFGPIIRTTL